MRRCDRGRLWIFVCLALALSACTLTETLPGAEIIPPLEDVSGLLEGICFEAALRLSGQVFTLKSQSELDSLYGQIDNLGICPHRMQRRTFDFGTGRAVLGSWTYATQGCKANHALNRLARDTTARTFALSYTFVVEGDCPYELIRPLWIAIEDAGGYALTLDIQR